ncbi:MAG TPA: FtsX-like permease family protein [Kofleriaceae bacterium]|nr:FtsX-like permease family protein [Kofleriaceae bacterium]
MMSVGRLARLVGHNAVRNRRHFALSAFGIVIGIASFIFFLSLSMGVRGWVLELFPIDQVEVIAPRTSLIGALGLDAQKKLDDAVAQKIRDHDGVRGVVPRMAIAFPAMGQWWYQDTKLKFDVVGDGIDPAYLGGDAQAALFRDFEAEEKGKTPQACGPAPKFPCQDLHYCDKRTLTCHHRVPMLISRKLVEIYNTQFAKSRGLPVIGAMEEFIVQRGGLSKMRLHMDLGATMVEATTKMNAPPRRIEGVLLGINDKAIPIGITVPIGYVKRWNQEFLGNEAATTYSSIVVQLEDKDDVGPFAAWVEKELDLRLQDSQGQQFALVIFVVTLFFLLISLCIVTISAINIAHNFFMQVSERRREIGLLRAVGASQADVRGMFLGEAALIGLIAGVIGIGGAVAAGTAVNLLARQFLPDLPFQPESFFAFEWWILGGGLVFSVLFCLLGGFLPARKASRMAPAQALVQQ